MLVDLTDSVDRYMQIRTHVTISTHLQPSRFTIWLFVDNLTLGIYPHPYAVGAPVVWLVYVHHVYAYVQVALGHSGGD